MKKACLLIYLLAVNWNLSFADIAVTAGTGTTIATDAPASVNYQKIKIADGTPNSTTMAKVDANGNFQVNVSSWPSTVSGTVKLQDGSGNSINSTNNALNTYVNGGVHIGATSAAVPASANFIGGNSSGNLIGLSLADTSIAISTATSGTWQIVAINGSKATYISSWDIFVSSQATSGSTVQLVYGTGTNCGVGQGNLTGVYQFGSSQGLARGNGSGFILKAPAANAVCIVTGASTQVSGSMSYTQY